MSDYTGCTTEVWDCPTTTANTIGWTHYAYLPLPSEEVSPIWDKMREKSKPKIEGVDYMKFYRVWMIYGEDRKNLIIKTREVVANSSEDAKVKSGLMKEVNDQWDADYLTFICESIGEVKIKSKPKEFKQV